MRCISFMSSKETETTGSEVRKSARPGKIVYVDSGEMVSYAEAAQLYKRKKGKGLKIFGLSAALAAAAAVTAYGVMTYYYSNRLFRGTVINGIDCSHMTVYEAEQQIAKAVEDYSIQINSRNLEAETIEGSDINYRYASEGDILKIKKEQNPFSWVTGLFRTVSYDVSTRATYDKKMLEEQVKSLAAAQEENQVEAENAYVAYKDGNFEIVPETEGSELLIKEAYKVLNEAILDEDTTIDFGTSEGVYAKADVTQDSPELLETLDACNNLANASITYTFGDQKVTLDGKTIQKWLHFDDKGQLIDNDGSFQEKAREYVAAIANQYDTVGTERPFDTTDGRTVYVYGSAYGWQIDQAAETAQLIADIRSGEKTTRDPIYSMTANSHGYNDFGDHYIEVDMGVQHMYYYQNGQIVFDSDFVSGLAYDPSRATPSGVYTLYSKQSPAVLRGEQIAEGVYEYETNVSFWMPFNGGIGFHDATWQPYFGSDRYLYGGSHGCINLPYQSASALYSIIEYGVPIICFY